MRREPWCTWVMVIGLAAILTMLALGTVRASDGEPPSTVSDLQLSDPFMDCDAIEPHIAAGPYDGTDGKHDLAAVWIQKQELGESCTSGGRAFLRWAYVVTQATASDWQGPVDPFESLLRPNEWVIHTDVAVVNHVAHVIAITKEGDEGETFPVTTTLRYAAYNLMSGSLITQSIIRTDVANSTLEMQLLEAVIAAGDDGTPHVAYSRRQTTGDDLQDESQIWYTRPVSGSWPAGVRITSNNAQRAYHPQIAWSRDSSAPYQGHVHIVWEYHKAADSNVSDYNGDVYYRRCLDDALSGEELSCGEEILAVDQTANHTHPRPAIAADGDTVAIVWNVCASLDPNPPCTLLALTYRVSNQGGEDFGILVNNTSAYEVRSNMQPDLAIYKYVGTDDEGIEYGSYLRPTAVISPDGGIQVAWQIVSATIGGSDAHYWPSVISTTWGYSPSVSLGKFAEWRDLSWREGAFMDARLLPDVASAPLQAEPSGGLHMLFMHSYDVNGEQRYRIEYSYFNEGFVPPEGGGNEDEDPYPNHIYLPLVLRGA